MKRIWQRNFRDGKASEGRQKDSLSTANSDELCVLCIKIHHRSKKYLERVKHTQTCSNEKVVRVLQSRLKDCTNAFLTISFGNLSIEIPAIFAVQTAKATSKLEDLLTELVHHLHRRPADDRTARRRGPQESEREPPSKPSYNIR